ncbi:ATP-binding protein [candidate division CSSED10-310 bacterium]|uniref:histidine kinase n=1 Tax=candidate division CSSED10-310 bacterium TaxID=2855610 RepID=A0ABV6Z405_UNCC1
MSNEGKFCLEVLRGPDAGKKFLLESDEIIVGRSRHCDVLFSDEAISRQHVQISFSETDTQSFDLKDLNSRNGVFINEEKVLKRKVHSGEYIHIGESVFTLRFLVDDEAEELMKTSSNVGLEEEDTEDSLVASIGVEKVKLFRFDAKKIDEKSIERRLQTLYKLGEIITMPGPLHEKLETILDMIYETVPAESGCILVKDRLSEKLEPIAVKYGSFLTKNKPMKVSWTIIDKSIKERIGILAADAQQDPRFDQAESVIAAKFRSVLSVPLFFHDTLMGTIFLNTSIKNEMFTQEDLEFLTGIANETAIVIEHNQMMNAQISREKMAEVGELVAGLSHYIKNVLFAFSAPQTIIDNALTKKDYDIIHSVWPILKKNAGVISDLVNDMLYFSKDKKPEKKLVNLHQVIQEVISLYKPIIRSKGIELEADCAEDVPDCNIDPQSFHRILLNLLKNAIDALTGIPSAKIIIRTQYVADEGAIELVVSDNGTGIAPQNVERIFHYLFSTKGYEGTGLGLYVTKKIVEDHGGSISVQSELGQGTTFIIRIPLSG